MIAKVMNVIVTIKHYNLQKMIAKLAKVIVNKVQINLKRFHKSLTQGI